MNIKEGEYNDVKRITELYISTKDQSHLIPAEQSVLFKRLITLMFGRISEYCFIDFVPEEPYEYFYIDEILNSDWKNRVIKVNTTGDNSGFWGSYNILFRAVHDYIHVKGSLDFNHNDEITAFKYQLEASKTWFGNWTIFRNLDWDLFAQLLRSEIIYQSAVKTHTKDFHLKEQKIILTYL